MKNFQEGPPLDNPNMSMGESPRPPAPATLGKFIKGVMLWSGGGAVIGLIFVLGTAILPTSLPVAACTYPRAGSHSWA